MTKSDIALAIGAVLFLVGVLLMGVGGRRGPGGWQVAATACLILGVLLIGYAGVSWVGGGGAARA
jgi:hypothetical protein